MAYIKDSVIGCFKKQLCELEHNPDKFSRVKAKFLKNYVIPTLEASKTADGMEVVKCCECKYCKAITDRDGNGVVYCDRTFAKSDVDPVDFCSYGERRTDDGLV